MDEKIRDEKQPEQQNDEYAEPSLLDIEDLESVSGGGCYTGGTIVAQPAEDSAG
ncbi:MAG TPA: hypothetical protein VKM72_27240 [Thermoanaerobaculia bacterium]|nr:hypothetical protein [Thermoanaerobaculia bacterium]